MITMLTYKNDMKRCVDHEPPNGATAVEKIPPTRFAQRGGVRREASAHLAEAYGKSILDDQHLPPASLDRMAHSFPHHHHRHVQTIQALSPRSAVPRGPPHEEPG